MNSVVGKILSYCYRIGSAFACSIESQKAILQQYAENNNLSNCQFFVDDGYTGTNFERPQFKEMLELIENDEVGVVVVKDCSRFGREYILTGYFTEMLFPLHDVRYIAINDNVDSAKGEDVFAPLINYLNDFYAKDTSKKIRSSIRIRASKGEYLWGKPPYGYIRDPERKNHLIPDESIVPYVKMMYEQAAENFSCYRIAINLREAKVPRPTAIMTGKDGKTCLNPGDKYPYEWCSRSVHDILTNQTYIGHFYACVKTRKTFKSKKVVIRPEEEWIKRLNDHEPLVDADTFYQVQELIQKRERGIYTSSPNNLYKGLIKCSECGRRMLYSVRTDRPGLGFYTCAKYRRNGMAQRCSSHYIKIEQISQLLLNEVRRLASAVVVNKRAFSEKLMETSKNELAMKNIESKKELEECEKRKSELNVLTRKVYEDHAFSRINDDIYQMLSVSYEEEFAKINDRMAKLNAALSKSRVVNRDVDKFMDAIAKYDGITEMTYDIAHELIDSIIVHGKENVDGISIAKIEVFYNHIGKVCDENGDDLYVTMKRRITKPRG